MNRPERMMAAIRAPLGRNAVVVNAYPKPSAIRLMANAE